MSYRKAGSLAMMEASTEGMDYLFPSSQAAVAYGGERGIETLSEEIALNSPIVVYTYRDVAEALVGSGVMSQDGDVYLLDVDAAVQAMLASKTWADLGYTAGYGQFRIDSTNPAQSNSGNEWAALIANSLAGGQPATVETVERDAAQIQAIFQKSGWMETSSEDSFRQFLTLGEGSKPMMVGYESQVLDLAVNEPDLFAQVADDLVVAYTTPHRLVDPRGHGAHGERRAPERFHNVRRGAEARVGAPRVPRRLAAGHRQRDALRGRGHRRARARGGGACPRPPPCSA